MLKENASLVVVGSGIKFISHLTTEAKAYITHADKVLYLLNEPAMKSWIQQTNANSESLDSIYHSYSLRQQSYLAITEYILQNVHEDKHVCVVLYGHPSVFATPALNAVSRAKEEGYFAKILPGISSEDCLFADLLIDPASHGCLSLEATDLLIHEKKIDISCHIVIWQVSIIGLLEHRKEYDNQNGLDMLYAYLIKYYPLEHELISYSASQYPGLEPIIKKFHLSQLKNAQFTRISTLYIPPLKNITSNKTVLEKLNIQHKNMV